MADRQKFLNANRSNIEKSLKNLIEVIDKELENSGFYFNRYDLDEGTPAGIIPIVVEHLTTYYERGDWKIETTQDLRKGHFTIIIHL